MSEFLILYAAMETSSQSALARVSGLFLVIRYPGAALLTTKLKYIRMLNAWETQDQKKKNPPMLSKTFDLEINGHELQFGFIISREILFLENNERYAPGLPYMHHIIYGWFILLAVFASIDTRKWQVLWKHSLY